MTLKIEARSVKSITVVDRVTIRSFDDVRVFGVRDVTGFSCVVGGKDEKGLNGESNEVARLESFLPLIPTNLIQNHSSNLISKNV